MPLKHYGVLRGRVVDRRLAADDGSHFQLHLTAADRGWRVAVNVASALEPSQLQYVVVRDFRHVLLDELAALPAGWSDLASEPGGAALDFIRGNLFDRAAMRTLPTALPGPDNDLNEALDHYVRRAIGDARATVWAFGERWGPEPGRADPVFGFEPGGGVHEVHMNQGNSERYAADDGVWQDGALLLHFPAPAQWVGIFLAFQSQAWHSDDATGHRLVPPAGATTGGAAVTPPPDGSVRIVALMPGLADATEGEFATLLNTTAGAIELDGWELTDRAGSHQRLHGRIAPGETLRIRIAPPLSLSHRGGTLTLRDAGGLKVDGVGYTAAQASARGRTIVF
jgi:uncharacterized protein YukJ